MLTEIGHVEAIFRYPVKSMGGEQLELADLGWHGLEGDRRLAFRRAADRSGFPWLTASTLPELILFAPVRRGLAVSEISRRTFARQKVRSWLCSARNCRRMSVAGMVHRSR